MAKNTPENGTKNEVKQGTMVPAALSSNDDVRGKKKTAKPNKKDPDKKPNIFKRMWKGIKGIISELKKVTWPKGKVVVKSTGVVLAVVVIFFVILFGIDYVLAGLLSLLAGTGWPAFGA